jgi:hypothetical protein
MRWVLRFNVDSGKDYLNQLGALDAAIVIPIPTDTEKAILIPNAKKPAEKQETPDKELGKLLERVCFAERRKEAVEAVAGNLGLDFKPTLFFAFLPKELEPELARKEKEYRNRLPSEIAETVFRVTLRDGKVEIVVVEQTPKKP